MHDSLISRDLRSTRGATYTAFLCSSSSLMGRTCHVIMCGNLSKTPIFVTVVRNFRFGFSTGKGSGGPHTQGFPFKLNCATTRASPKVLSSRMVRLFGTRADGECQRRSALHLQRKNTGKKPDLSNKTDTQVTRPSLRVAQR